MLKNLSSWWHHEQSKTLGDISSPPNYSCISTPYMKQVLFRQQLVGFGGEGGGMGQAEGYCSAAQQWQLPLCGIEVAQHG